MMKNDKCADFVIFLSWLSFTYNEMMFLQRVAIDFIVKMLYQYSSVNYFFILNLWNMHTAHMKWEIRPIKEN